MTESRIKRLSLGAVVCAALAVMLTVTAIQPAKADDNWDRRNHGSDRGGDRDWQYHAQHVRRHYTYRHPVVVGDVYAPPLVVSPPPPAYYYGPPQPVYEEPPASPSLNFVIPLHIH